MEPSAACWRGSARRATRTAGFHVDSCVRHFLRQSERNLDGLQIVGPHVHMSGPKII